MDSSPVGRLRLVMSVGFREFDEEKNASTFVKMSDEELIREGKAARFLCSPSQDFVKPPQRVFVIGLRLCKERVAKEAAGRVTEQLDPIGL